MKNFSLAILLLFLLSVGAFAQTPLYPSHYTIAAGPNQIPAASTLTNKVVNVTDGLTKGDCTVGGGVVKNACISDGSSWLNWGGDGTGAGGTLTAVNGTTPINSSGGSTPSISIDTADATHIGALSAANWVTFNSKEAPGIDLRIANNLSDLGNAGTARGNLGGTTVGIGFFTFTNPSAIRFPRIEADNSVTGRTAAQLLSDIAAQAALGYTPLNPANNLSDVASVGTSRTNLGGTTVGQNLFTATNPSAISFPKIAADNSVSFRTPAQLLSDIGAQAAGSYEVPLTFSTGLTRTVNTITVNTSQNIATLSNLTGNGFVKTGGGIGTLSIDTSTYLTANQTISFAPTGDVTGTTTGTTTLAPVLTIGAGKVTLAMQANMATASLIYRKTAGSGAPEVNTLATLKTDLGLTGTNSGDVTLAGENYLSIAGQVITANAVALGGSNVSGILTSPKGGTGVNNAGTITNANNTTITGGGTIALGGFTFTIPATGTAVLTTRALTAGAGLTGGGDLSVDRTFNVGAGTLISVGADDVGITPGAADYGYIGSTTTPWAAAWRSLSTLAGAGLTHAAGVLAVGAGNGITVNADDVALTTPGTLTVSTTNSSSGSHTHAITSSSNPGAAASLLASNASGYLQLVRLGIGTTPTQPLEVSGNLFVNATTGNLYLYDTSTGFNATPSVISLLSNNRLQSLGYVSQTTGFGLDSATGAGDFRYLFADELRVKLFTADLESVLAGSQRVTKSFSTISQTFTCPANSATSTLWLKDSPSFGDAAVFVSGDSVVIHSMTRTVFGPFTITDCVGVVTAYADGSGGTAGQQSWTFTRNANPNGGTMTLTGGVTVAANELAQDMGTTGNGYVETSAVDGAAGVNAPYTQIVTWATAPVSANLTVRARLGNLKGISGTAEYGLIAGTYSASNGAFFRASDQNFDLHGITAKWWDTTTNVVTISPNSGSPYVSLGNPAPTSYGANAGIFLEWNHTAAKARASFYADANNYLQYDGTKLTWKAANTTLDSLGNLTATSATLSGAITATSGSIGSFTIGTYLYSGSKTAYNDGLAGVHLGSDGIGLGSTFTVSAAGALTATSGTIAGWAINSASMSSGTTYLASSFNFPTSGQVAWFGKESSTARQGFHLQDASVNVINALVGDGTVYPYIQVYDGVGGHNRVVIGGLNKAFESDGSTASMGMKIWSSAGVKLVEFSDVQNIIAGLTIAGTKMYTGTGTFNNSNTAFYVDNAGQFSLKDKLSWDGTTLTIIGGGTFSGALSAATGSFAGSLSAATGSFSGTVTATVGTIGGFSLGADYIRDAANSFGLASTVTGGDDVRFWAGDTFANRATAAFHVTEAGAVTATNATITGTVNATAGNFSGIALTGLMTMGGSSSAIAIGNPVPTSATVGTGLWLDRTGLYGLAANVLQAKFDAATGVITAGAGTVTLDSVGLRLAAANSSTSWVGWVQSGITTGHIVSYHASSPSQSITWLQSGENNVGAGMGRLLLMATNESSHSATLELTSDMGTPDKQYATFTFYNTAGSGLVIGGNSVPNAMLDVRGDVTITGKVIGQGVQLGSPTGGDKGVGTINAASNIYINGVAISVGALPSQTGHAGQYLNTDGTNAGWAALAGGGDALVAQPLSQFAATTSAQLAGVLSDESGTSGGFVRSGGGALTALTGLAIRSTGAAFDLTFASSEVLTAGRTLTIVMGDAARTLTLGASPSLSGNNTGDQTITLTSDVTGSGTGSFAATIAANAVTLSKMATMATASLLGRNTAATGNVEVLSASTARSLLGLVIGTNVQAWDADLDTLAGLTATTDNFIVSVASAWASRTPAQVKTTLGLSTTNTPQFARLGLGQAADATAQFGITGHGDSFKFTIDDTTSYVQYAFYEGTAKLAAISYAGSTSTGFLGGPAALALGTILTSPVAIFTNATVRMSISGAGAVTITNLAGTGSRAVLADASGVLSAPVSDARLKMNIRSISSEMDVLAKLDNLNGVYFNFIPTEGIALTQDRRQQIGVLANEFEKVLPEMVGYNAPVNGVAYRYLDYEKIGVFNLEVEKALKARLISLESVVNEQQKQIEMLRDAVKQLSH